MSCCQCQGIETQFNDKYVARSLKNYRKKGPAKTTRMLFEAIKAEGVVGCTLLDIGGGVGIIQYELLKAGAEKAISVEASSAYAAAAREEARRQGQAERISIKEGDFVDLARDIPTVDVVTLERVICCYDDVETLVGLSAERAGKLYGVVYPRDSWWVRTASKVINLFATLFRRQFRTFIHPTQQVEAIVQSKGLKQYYYNTTGTWQVVVYRRDGV